MHRINFTNLILTVIDFKRANPESVVILLISVLFTFSLVSVLKPENSTLDSYKPLLTFQGRLINNHIVFRPAIWIFSVNQSDL